MNDLHERARQAHALWAQGRVRLAAGDLDTAYRLLTEAHDLVTDCPALHREAHRQLLAVNRVNGRRGEEFTDRLLLALAPLGVFTLIARFFRSKVTGETLCRRAA